MIPSREERETVVEAIMDGLEESLTIDCDGDPQFISHVKYELAHRLSPPLVNPLALDLKHWRQILVDQLGHEQAANVVMALAAAGYEVRPTELLAYRWRAALEQVQQGDGS